MPQQIGNTVENNFTKGLITDTTGLNFPENAATDTDNCVYTLIGDVNRRQGINFESGFVVNPIGMTNCAVSNYLWKNAGGDGSTQLLVQQVGRNLTFHNASSSSPVSGNLASQDFNGFQVSGTATDLDALECQFADGNGYLFVYHPLCQPFYCSYVPGGVSVVYTPIDVKVRDFTGIPENTDVNLRPNTLSNEHQYNLVNQGWVSGNPWLASSTTAFDMTVHSQAFTVAAGLVGVVGGSVVALVYSGPGVFTGGSGGYLPPNTGLATGTITSYVGTTLTINVTYVHPAYTTAVLANWNIYPISSGYISTWFGSIGNYPSNADVWWYFKSAAGAFDPTTSANISLASGNAPRGHFLLSAFNQNKVLASGLGVTNIVTTKRPSTGAWFQGRVWYTGLDDSQAPTGDAPYYTWTENIYFSQIVVGVADFGSCFQVNDPTSEQLFDLLPTDGGVITIQGSGRIYKLFPIQNGMLVFAANGVWFITGSQGIGFSANDYTITKISSIRSISSTSFVDVNGLPYFWNEEAIYSVTPSQQGQLTVEPLTVGVIGNFYEAIPLISKKYVRGVYDPIEYRVQWLFKSTLETDVSSRYQYDRALNFNTFNKAFYPYTFVGTPKLNSIVYISSPGNIVNARPEAIKYFTSWPGGGGNRNVTYSEEYITVCLDFPSFDGGTSYESFFITGYKLRGQAIRKFQPTYLQVYSRVAGVISGYKVQGIWDFATDRNSNRWTTIQSINLIESDFYSTVFRRHKIRGHGYALQFKITSQEQKPFDIQGWSVMDSVNAGT